MLLALNSSLPCQGTKAFFYKSGFFMMKYVTRYVQDSRVDVRGRTSTYVDVRRRTWTYVDVRGRTWTYVDVRPRTSTYVPPGPSVVRAAKYTKTVALHYVKNNLCAVFTETMCSNKIDVKNNIRFHFPCLYSHKQILA